MTASQMPNSATQLLKKYNIKKTGNKTETKISLSVLRYELKKLKAKYIYDLSKDSLISYLKAYKADDKVSIRNIEELGRKKYESYNK